MKLGTGDTITLEGVGVILSYRITLDVNKQRVYFFKYSRTKLFRVISSDYDGNDEKSIDTYQNLNRRILGVWDNSILVMKRDEARILMKNETDSNLFREITIENSEYFDLIVFNNKFDHTSGK